MFKKNKQIVGYYDVETKVIKFYEVKEHRGRYTILASYNILIPPSLEDPAYIIYDNKTRCSCRIMAGDEIPSKIDTYNYIFTYERLFFWADSPLVTQINHPAYNNLWATFEQVIDFNKHFIESQAWYKNTLRDPNTSIFVKIAIFILKNTRERFMFWKIRRSLKGMKIIW